MRVRLLGPVDVLIDDIPRPVRGLRRTAVLAALALRPGAVVSVDRLVEAVWGTAAPASAATTVQSHVSYLRGVLNRREAITARRPGYLLDLDEREPTDVQAAERLIRQGMESAAADARASRLQAAVALWRGAPLAELTGLAWFDEQAQRLEQLLLQARHALIDARMALGQHLQLVPELSDLSRQHPLHEQVHAQLMLALYRAGRQCEALAVYQRLRRTLADELGIDPSQPLRELEIAVLRQDPALDLPSSPSPAYLTRSPPTAANRSGRPGDLGHGWGRKIRRCPRGRGQGHPHPS
ncbi:AfsR/SARP family transcriptional regulator [Nonomuraea sp. NEAU-A123]|uniref:AfsR/SARP family transcriptional regulator n=1 Tax=Nonomuraea sp. NEAU-A123 TaxID=2839649 RepID=UPI001BE42DA2|nr:AfsR/SARP family transcriptional regulator [Nonomuraea sp. NEAU-A123]MBT2232083.1 AfsR/SARP family transcriptional regulator [Nonomuraea sp. NEAU-A123]